MTGLAAVALALNVAAAAAAPAHGRSASGASKPPTARELARGIKCSGEHHCVLHRALVERVLANQDALAQTVRVTPAEREGAPAGFRLDGMKAGSPLWRLGLRDGDVIESVNGLAIDTPANALLAYLQLRNASDFAVRIVRHGEPLTFTYEIR